MSVSTLLVLSDKASGLIDDQITEQWFSSYVGELNNYVAILHYHFTSVKSNYIKLKDEVGMAVPKSTSTRMVGIITFTWYISTLAFLLWFMYTVVKPTLHSLPSESL